MARKSRLRSVVALALLTSTAMVACRASGPPIMTASGSLRDVRKTLEGAWELDRFERMAPDGTASEEAAQGRLTYDRFGHMAAQGRVGGKVDAPELTYEGRAVIDTRRRTISIRPPSRAPSSATARVRRYEFLADGRLRLELIGPRDVVEARLTWRRTGD